MTQITYPFETFESCVLLLQWLPLEFPWFIQYNIYLPSLIPLSKISAKDKLVICVDLNAPRNHPLDSLILFMKLEGINKSTAIAKNINMVHICRDLQRDITL